MYIKKRNKLVTIPLFGLVLLLTACPSETMCDLEVH